MSAPEHTIRVLIADDDPMLRDIASATLESAGFEVQVVDSGVAAIAACALRMPDIALLDVEMPDGDGYHACAAIHALPGGAHVPIVMVTGHDDAQSIDRAYDVGATDFVVKPINWALIVHRIRYVRRGARTLEALRVSEQKNAALLETIPDGIFLVDADGTIRHRVSPVAGLTDGGASDEPGSRLTELLPVAARDKAADSLGAALRGAPTAFEFPVEMRGVTHHYECRYAPNAAGQALAIIRDVTDRRQTEARIHHLAYFDALTDLPNREWLGEYLARSLAEAQRDGGAVAVLYVDLDQFKRINDTLGHETGDALLRMVADRLNRSLDVASAGAGIRLARVGGDEFIAVITGQTSEQHAREVAVSIQSTLATPFLYDGYEFVVTPSIGIAVFPEHGSDTQTLLKNADGAMYEAKASGRNQYRVYTSAVNARALKRLSLEMELRHAFDRSELQVYYQPKYDARSLNLSGGEALLRWFHPERGQIPTADFVAVAEETGLISDIGRWAMQRVCQDVRHWRSRGLAVPAIAVNLSGRDFMRPDAVLQLSRLVEAAQLPAAHFELELTEGVLMQDVEAGRRSLFALKEIGFRMAVDDFGTGYCSLSYLKRFPLDTLKIDRSFVKDICTDADDAAIARAIIALGHNLGLAIVAEGVETQAQLAFLRDEGCESIQGFLMSPGIAAQAFAQLLRPAIMESAPAHRFSEIRAAS